MRWTLMASIVSVLMILNLFAGIDGTKEEGTTVLKRNFNTTSSNSNSQYRTTAGTKQPVEKDEERSVKLCNPLWHAPKAREYENNPLIVVITPTRKRLTRIADMTRLSQTLTLVENLAWVVVEESNFTFADPMKRILERSLLPFCYIAMGLPESSRGKQMRRVRSRKQNMTKPVKEAEWRWRPREAGLRAAIDRFKTFGPKAIVYFADQEGSYDYRLFDRFIRKVRSVGVWAVGLPDDAGLVIAPKVSKAGIVEGWLKASKSNNWWEMEAPGFAISMKLLASHPNISLSDCGTEFPAQCLMGRLGVKMQDVQPFGHNTYPKRVLVWRTTTFNDFAYGPSYDYIVECEPFVDCTL